MRKHMHHISNIAAIETYIKKINLQIKTRKVIGRFTESESLTLKTHFHLIPD